MPRAKIKVKHKTHKASAKRFKVTATGKVMHKKRGKRHGMNNKSADRKRQLKTAGEITGKQASTIKVLLGKK